MKKRIAVFLLFGLLIIFSYRVVESYNYDSDFGRDVTEMLEIVKGHPRLIGPKLSFGGIFTGPYYYYLFVPVLMIGRNLSSILYANAALFAVSLTGCWYLLYRQQKKLLLSLVAVVLLAIQPFWLFSARGPGNAFTYMPLMALLLCGWPFIWQKNVKLWWFLWGVGVGVMVNFHLISGLVMAMLWLVGITWVLFKKQMSYLRGLLLVPIGVLLMFGPLFLFEIRHDFVMFKNTFINKSYQAFTDNTNLPTPLKTSSNPLINSKFLATYFSQWSTIPYALLLVITIAVIFNVKIKSEIRHLFIAALLSFMVLAIVGKFQLAFHYFYPFLLAAFVSVMFIITHSRLGGLVGIGLVFISIAYFPRHMYQPAQRPFLLIESRANSVLNAFQFNGLKTETYNVFVIRETPLAVLGWEYRYYFHQTGYISQSPFLYNQSKYLIVIDETKKTPVESLQSWELTEFGEKKLVKSVDIDTAVVSMYQKI